MEGLAKLTVLTSALQLSPVVLIWMFPTGKQAVFDSLKHEVCEVILLPRPHATHNQSAIYDWPFGSNEPLTLYLFPLEICSQVLSKQAGAIFVFVLFASILGTVIYSIAIIYEASSDDDDDVCDDDDDDSNASLLFKSRRRLFGGL